MRVSFLRGKTHVPWYYPSPLSDDRKIDVVSVCPVKQNPFNALRRVSGKLRQMWVGREEKSEPPTPRLLVVDDEESICFSMSEYFSLQGYKVDTASEIEEAEKLLGATKYRVVIQDLRLTMTSNQDGLNMIKMIRQHNPQTRIVVLTAYGSPELEDEARRNGADAFLRKPKPLSQVAQVVQGLLEAPPRQAARPA
jgi:CheY-like chemotaxis protein